MASLQAPDWYSDIVDGGLGVEATQEVVNNAVVYGASSTGAAYGDLDGTSMAKPVVLELLDVVMDQCETRLYNGGLDDDSTDDAAELNGAGVDQDDRRSHGERPRISGNIDDM